MAVVAMSSCSLARQPIETTKQSIEQVIAEKAAAEQQRDQAITTSAQAKQAASLARKDAESAKAYAEEKDQEAKRLDKIASDLRTQEISAGITRASWWFSGSGILALAGGIFLFLRFGSKTGLTIAITGAAAFAIGIIGLLIAPHWIAYAWGGAIALLLALICGITYLLHEKFGALKEVTHGTQKLKDRFFPKMPDGSNPEIRNEINKILSDSQKKHRKTIDELLRKS
jgi:hypothetical protein